MVKKRVILGVDPGTNITGFGIITSDGKSPVLLIIDVINLSKEKDIYRKLQIIFDKTLELIDHYQVTELAIEAPFFGKNVQSMLKLGRAQGTAIAAALFRRLPITEYAPRKIKLAITGNGDASKEQVASMLQKMLNLKTLPQDLDATDGLAAAICHYYQNGMIEGAVGSKAKSWKQFLADNPERIKK
ncbi:MAG TPA: crossover junction endodeoxyribonuclease RuvC [Bacteroidales bacterium]|nr:crossover junction endodeoxyribonuclease RuvC [Bacteroidales bacterium]